MMRKAIVLFSSRIIMTPIPFQRYQYQQYQPVLLIFVGQANLSIIITTFAPELKQLYVVSKISAHTALTFADCLSEGTRFGKTNETRIHFCS
jgi:hypothetical protein